MSISQNFPEEGPTLNLNFAGSRTLDPRITFTRTQTTSNGSTYMGRDGLIKYAGPDEPRFDHRYVNGEIESLGLLVEEQRTNIKPYSESLEYDLSWSRIYISVNEIISPDGLQTADGIVPDDVDGPHFQDKVFTSISGITTSQNICSSIFVKKGVGRDVWLQIYEESGNAYHGVQFNFETEELTFRNSNEYTSGNGITTDYGFEKYPNGWYRIWVAGYPNTTTTGRRFRLRLTDADGNLNFVGDTVSSYLYGWGLQVEFGAFPTSYIPRPDTSTATRTTDNASITGSNFTKWYNQDEGTIYVSQKLKSIDTVDRNSLVYLINGGSGSDIFYNVKNGDTNIFVFGDNGTNYSRWQENGDSTDTKAIWAYDVSGDDFKPYWNGIEGVNESNSSSPSATSHTQLEIGATVGAKYNGHIAQLTYYPQRLPNSQLVSLTR
jgi:hypothetical protein